MNVTKKRPAAALEDDCGYHSLSPKKSKHEPATEPSLDPAAPATLDLEQLVNITDLARASHTSIKQRFNSIAEAILCNHYLVVGSSDGTKKESAYEVLELEFYLWMEGAHADPFTHGSEEQRICGQWYFHRAPKFSMDSHRSLTSQTMYRAGSRKGLDLTIGRPLSVNELSDVASMSRLFPTSEAIASNGTTNATIINPISNPTSAPAPDIRGGILLRSLRPVSGGKVICGPSLLVDELLQSSNSDSILDLVTSKWSGDINAFRSNGSTFLCFRRRPHRQLSGEPITPQTVPQDATEGQKKAQSPSVLPPTVYCSPRIGLELSHPGTTLSRDHPRLLFLSKHYRFFTHPELLEKGRPQTFIGILHSCLRNGHTLRASGNNGGTIDSFFGKSGKSGKSGSNSRTSGSGTSPNEKLRAEVVKIMGVKEATVEKYFTEYFAGLDKGVMKLYIGQAGKGASTSPATYLRMVGALERFLDYPC